MSCLISFYTNEQELLKALIKIHNEDNDIELDPMYFKGNFYKNGVNAPKYKFDINPQFENVVKANAKNLPLDSGSISCMILDPPFLFEKRNREQKNYVSQTHTMFHNGFEELEECYKGILKEAHRVLKNKGILIFKCQDYTDAKTTMTHCYVWEWAKELGFYAKDIAILNIPQSKIYNPNLKQRHFRKTHTYFWVFQKVRKVDCLNSKEQKIADLEEKLAESEKNFVVANNLRKNSDEVLLNYKTEKYGLDKTIKELRKIKLSFPEKEWYYKGFENCERQMSSHIADLTLEVKELKQQLAEKDEQIEYLKGTTVSIENFENAISELDQDKISFAVEKLKQLRHDIWTNQADDGYTDMQVDLYDLNDMIDIAIGQLTHQHEDKGE